MIFQALSLGSVLRLGKFSVVFYVEPHEIVLFTGYGGGYDDRGGYSGSGGGGGSSYDRY